MCTCLYLAIHTIVMLCETMHNSTPLLWNFVNLHKTYTSILNLCASNYTYQYTSIVILYTYQYIPIHLYCDSLYLSIHNNTAILWCIVKHNNTPLLWFFVYRLIHINTPLLWCFVNLYNSALLWCFVHLYIIIHRYCDGLCIYI